MFSLRLKALLLKDFFWSLLHWKLKSKTGVFARASCKKVIKHKIFQSQKTGTIHYVLYIYKGFWFAKYRDRFSKTFFLWKIWKKIFKLQGNYGVVKLIEHMETETENWIHASFYKQRFFSTLLQFWLTFSWIVSSLKHTTIIILRQIIYLVY